MLNAEGTTVVLSAAMDTKTEVRWSGFPAPLETGAWRVKVAFDGQTKGAKTHVLVSSPSAPRWSIATTCPVRRAAWRIRFRCAKNWKLSSGTR